MKFYVMRRIVRFFKQKYKSRLIKRFKRCGNNLIVEFRLSSFSFASIEIGNNVFIGSNAWFYADLVIGTNVMFGPSCKVIGGDHIFGIKGLSNRFLVPKDDSNSKPIIIEDEVWCGANVIILKGVNVGIGSVIGAGSVVTKNVPPFTVNFGNPCKPVKIILDDNNLRQHLQMLNYNSEFIEETILKRHQMLGGSSLMSLFKVHDNSEGIEYKYLK